MEARQSVHTDLHVGEADPCCHGNEIWASRGVQSLTGFCLGRTVCLFGHSIAKNSECILMKFLATGPSD